MSREHSPGPGCSERSDKELVEATRQGDVGAYDELYRRHRVAALKLATRYANQAADRDDMVSQAFADIYQAIRNGHGPRDGAFRTYMLACVRRLGGSLHAPRGAREGPLDEEALRLPDTYHRSPDASAEDLMVLAAFEALPERARIVLWHSLVEDEDAETIGEFIGQSRASVNVILHRARERFRLEYLAQHLNPGAPAKCGITREQIAGAARGKIAGRQPESVQAHIDTCPECQARLAELTEIERAMRGVVAPAVLGIPVAAYRSAHVGTAWWQTGIFKGAVAGAAAVAAVVTAVLLFAPDGAPAAEPSQPPAAVVTSLPGTGASPAPAPTAASSAPAVVIDPATPSAEPTGQAPEAAASGTPVSNARGAAGTLVQPAVPNVNPGDAVVIELETRLSAAGTLTVDLPRMVTVDSANLASECRAEGDTRVVCNVAAGKLAYPVPVVVDAAAARGQALQGGVASLSTSDGQTIGPIDVQVVLPPDPC